jgi:hypothetical protein
VRRIADFDFNKSLVETDCIASALEPTVQATFAA